MPSAEEALHILAGTPRPPEPLRNVEDALRAIAGGQPEAGGGEPRPGSPENPSHGTGGQRKPRVEVYLGMIPELRKKVEDKHLKVSGMITREDTDIGEDIRTPDFEHMEDIDQVLLATLNELNRAVQQNTERWSLTQRRRIEWGEEAVLKLVGEDGMIYKRLHTLIPTLDNMHQYIGRFWLAKRGGDVIAMSKLVEEAGQKLDNGILWSLLEDPVVESAFHEIKGVEDISNDFTVGATRKHKDPNSGQTTEYTIRGGSYGGAEKMGHFIRWISGWGFYDSPPDAATNAYMAYKIRWWPEYALGKGWFNNIRNTMYEITPDNRVQLHTISAFPSLWHAPNLGGLVDYYMGFMGGTGRNANMEAVRADDLDWKDKARLMCWYSDSDIRILGGIDIPYRREEFENADEVGQRQMFERAIGIWQQMTPEQRKTILQNNLLNDRYIADGAGIRGGHIVSRDFDLRRLKFGVKPVIDLDSKRADGSYRINLADILFYCTGGERVLRDGVHIDEGTAGAGEWANNEFTYEGYAAKTEALWEKIAKEGVVGVRELFQNLLKAGDPSEAYRQLYGKVNPETNEREGTLQKWIDETGWIMETHSDMFFYSLWADRMRGLRVDQVAVPINEYTRLGLYQKFSAEEFDDTGNEGHDWRTMYRNQIRNTEGRVAKVLGKFGSRDAWTHYLRNKVLAGTRFANLTDEQMFQALAVFAGFRMLPNEKSETRIAEIDRILSGEIAIDVNTHQNLTAEKQNLERTLYEGEFALRERIEQGGRVVQEGRVARYFNFDIDRQRTWGRQMFRDQFNDLMIAMQKGIDASGAFSVFNEAMDEERIVFNLIDGYVEKTFDENPARRIKKDWGVPQSYYRREVEVNQILRDYLRYGIGRYRGNYALDQLTTVTDWKSFSGKTVDDQPDTVRQVVEIGGRRAELITENVHLAAFPIRDKEGQVSYTVMQPEFAMFHWGDKGIGWSKGRDRAWTLTQGTGEWMPGMEEKITPLYRHYNKNRYMYFVGSMFFDPLFRLKVLQNSGEDWEDHLGFFYVCNPRKISLVINKIATIESDQTWISAWRRKLNVADTDVLKEFDHQMRELRVLSAEQARIKDDATEEDIATLSGLLISSYKMLEPTGIFSKTIGRAIGARTWREFWVRAGGMVPGAVGVGIPLAAMTANPVIGGLAALVGGIASTVVIGGDAGIDEHYGYEKEMEGSIAPVIGPVRNIRYLWKSKLGLMGSRIRHRSYESIATHKRAVWDDIVPDDIPFSFFKDGHDKLQPQDPSKAK